MSLIKDLSKTMQDAQEIMSSEAFIRLGGILTDNKSAVREKIQADTSGVITTIIGKLEAEKALSSEDLKTLRLWIIGDAESYTRMENNFSDWLKEFKRLASVLKDYEGKEPSPDDLVKLHGILEDAARVAYDISNFLEKKQRIAKFEQATQNPASLDSETLSRVLKAKLASPTM